ncbi:glycosyltransferase family 4 protein [Parvibaculaceae bacterium PLY_AMNH_Bact1]|nr:glycosyltransferase family 4 protein [Parvibaculaceae bacterium PLY_AMNH_Bact1]
MRVLQLVKTSHGARWALEQVQELCKMGVEVHVALPNLAGGFANAWTESGAKVHIVDIGFPARELWRLPSVISSFKNLVERVQPDLIHSHFVSTTLTMRMALQNDQSIKRVFQVPGPLHLENAIFRNWELTSSNSQDYWIASSNFIEKLYRDAGISQDRLFLSYYGNHLSDEISSARTEMRKLFGISEEQRVVGSISYMYPPKYFLGQVRGLKRHEVLIKAFSHLGELRSDVTGVLIGGQWGGGKSYERRLRRRAKSVATMRIEMPGAIPPQNSQNVWPLFDLAVHIPSTENCGGVVEPLAAGVPVLTNRVGGIPEVVIDGVSGLSVEEDSPKNIAIAINRALNDLPKLGLMAKEGQSLVKTMFDVRRTAAEIRAIYEHILNEGQKPKRFNSRDFLETNFQEKATNVVPLNKS